MAVITGLYKPVCILCNAELLAGDDAKFIAHAPNLYMIRSNQRVARQENEKRKGKPIPEAIKLTTYQTKYDKGFICLDCWTKATTLLRIFRQKEASKK